MKRVFLTIIVLVTALTALAQATQPCIVKQYNQKQTKTPLAGVQVEVRDAGSAISDKAGQLTLKFATLKPGDKVTLRRITKTGFEIFNKTAIEQWNVSSNRQRFEIVLVQSSYFAQLKSKLTQSSTDNYKKKYEQEKAEKARLLKEGKLKEEEYRQQLNDLEDQYDNALKNLDNYIDQFARIDLSEVSAEEQRILDMVQAGQIDEAVKAYEALDISGKLRQARENKKALSEAKARIEEEEAQQEQAIKDLKEKQQREIATLKLAGGKENYDKVAQILKENALADTTDIDAVWQYATFAEEQRQFKDAERFYLICLNNIQNPYQQLLVIRNLGVLDEKQKKYDMAEQADILVLKYATQLFHQDSLKYRYELARAQHVLGNLYLTVNKYDMAKPYLDEALKNFIIHNDEEPGSCIDAITKAQNSLGNYYQNKNDWSNAEKYLLASLKNAQLLFEKDSLEHEYSLVMAQNNLASMYYKQHELTKAEKYFLAAYHLLEHLASSNPNAYQFSLYNVEMNLGTLYDKLEDKEKAELYLKKSLQGMTQLADQNAYVYMKDLVVVRHNMGSFYDNYHDYEKAEAMYNSALKGGYYLYDLNPDIYRQLLLTVQNSLGTMYIDTNDYNQAENLLLSALEHTLKLVDIDKMTYMPSLAMVYNNLGLLYTRNNNIQKAINYYTLSIDIKKQTLSDNYQDIIDITRSQRNLATLFHKVKDYEKAEENHQQVLQNLARLNEHYPHQYIYEYASELNSLAWIAHQRKDFQKGIEYYQKAIESLKVLSEDNTEKYLWGVAITQSNLASTHSQLGDSIRAEECYLAALENSISLYNKSPNLIENELIDLQMETGMFYLNKKDYTNSQKYHLDALNTIKQSLKTNTGKGIYKKLALTHYRLGFCYWQNRDSANTEKHYLHALDAFTQIPDSLNGQNEKIIADIQFKLAYLYESNDDFIQAEKHYLKAMDCYADLTKKQPDAYRSELALIQYALMHIYVKDNEKLGKYYEMLDAALANYEARYKNDKSCQPYIVELRIRKGNRLLQKGEISEALMLFEGAYQLDPKKSTPYLVSGCNEKAYGYAKSAEYTKAIETIDRAIALMPEDANLYDSKGEILLMKGEELEALKMWRKVIELDPDFLKKHHGTTPLYEQLKEIGLLK